MQEGAGGKGAGGREGGEGGARTWWCRVAADGWLISSSERKSLWDTTKVKNKGMADSQSKAKRAKLDASFAVTGEQWYICCHPLTQMLPHDFTAASKSH